MDRGPVVPLGGEHWSHAEGELIRQAAFGSLPQESEHREVRVRPGLAKPLLTDGPGAVAENPRHVGVQNYRQSADGRRGHHRASPHRDEVMC